MNAFIASDACQRAVQQLRLAENLRFSPVGISLISEVRSNVERVSAQMICRDLYRPTHAVAHVFHKHAAGDPIALSDAMREHKFGVGIDARPQPVIAAFRSDRPSRDGQRARRRTAIARPFRCGCIAVRAARDPCSQRTPRLSRESRE